MGSSAIMANFELVDDVSHVFHKPRSARMTNTDSHLQFSFKV